MTLQNLKYALYINNLILLGKIKTVQDLINTTDIDLGNHLDNFVIHVTQEDKDAWNAMLENAKKYAKELFDSATSLQAIKVNELPTEDIKEMCIYLISTDPKENNYYEEYMYIDNQWELIGNTKVNLESYILKTEVEELLKDYLPKKDSHTHENMDIINELSDTNGLLNYRGTPISPVITDIDIQQAITDTLKILNKEE